MRLKAILFSTLAISAVYARGANQAGASDLTVYVHGGEAVPPAILEMGQVVASQILAEAGIRITWRHSKPAQQARPETAMIVEIEANCGNAVPGLALASAHAYEGTSITVHYCRMKWAEQRTHLAPRLFGHVLAHEITHNLQMVARHSDSGVMAARWTADDFSVMSLHPLAFEPIDVELIQLGLRVRAAGTSDPADPAR